MNRATWDLIRPSNLAKVLACPASASREAEYPATTSAYAREGIVAHQFAAAALQMRVPAAMYIHDTVDGITCDSEMAEHLQFYLDYVAQLCASGVTPVVEAAVSLTLLDGKTGTVDCAVLTGTELHVVDLKYGRGVAVSAERNPQLMAYAQGLLDEWEPLIDDLEALTVHLHIVQPRASRAPNVWTTNWHELMRWEVEAKRSIAEALGPTPRYAAGEHCRFCAAKVACTTFNETAMRAPETHPVSADTPLPDVDPAAISAALQAVPAVRLWLSTVEELGYQLLAGGVAVPGFKLVEGRRSRRWVDDESMVAQAKRKRLPIDVYNPRALASVAGLEKELGKKKFVELGFADITALGAGKPTVVAESDPRPALQPSVAGADDFATDDDLLNT